MEGDSMKEKLNQYKHVLLLLYFPVYLTIFRYLEENVPKKFHIISSPLDQYIPFVAIFIVPYLLWFLYMAVAGIYLLFFEKECFCRMMYFGMIGMSIFLLVSWLYPNGLNLRPTVFAEDNIFVRLTQYVYSVDTATNVLPSIHVFNSVGVCIAIRDSERLGKNRVIQAGSTVATVLIILSTMFVKQHSVVDVMAGLVLSAVAWELVYGGRAAKLYENILCTAKYRKKRRSIARRVE
ncbi:MAG: phosphatase PAP2 family protein [Eubacteriales bacterium]|nr:phosphatase PAP2 family protein [Eubacteriales bacterium]